MRTIGTTVTKVTLIAASFLTNEIAVAQDSAEQVNLDILCSKFPLNSRCRDYDYSSVELKQTTLKINRETLCTRFPENSHCLKEPPQFMTIKLDGSGKDDEWIRIEKQDNTFQILHTIKKKDGLVSGLFNGALGLVPVPLPFVNLNNYDWKDHQVTGVAFQPDGCQSNSCTVTGIDTLILPEGTDIYTGLLTVKYQEKELARSVTFRVPTDTQIETINTVTITTPKSNAWKEQTSAKDDYEN
ncbi:MAG: hypothetical protein ACFB2X_17055 [Rivularia sp. (in: cyanobacteria)]